VCVARAHDLAQIVNKGEVIGLIAMRPKIDNPDWKELRESQRNPDGRRETPSRERHGDCGFEC
jgi:hypothetical protein